MAGDTAKGKAAYHEFLALLERCRSRHPHPEGSQSGAREAAVAGKSPAASLAPSDGLRNQAISLIDLSMSAIEIFQQLAS
jgi:hypothetical protein